MESRVDHAHLQNKWQSLRENCYVSSPNNNKNYTILNAPPNVTAKQVHLGHLLNGTLNDIMARRKR